MNVQGWSFLLLWARRPAFRMARINASGTGSALYARTARLARTASLTLSLPARCSALVMLTLLIVDFPHTVVCHFCALGGQKPQTRKKEVLLYALAADHDDTRAGCGQRLKIPIAVLPYDAKTIIMQQRRQLLREGEAHSDARDLGVLL